MSISRRNFLFASSGAAAGSMFVPGLAEVVADADSKTGVDFSKSGLVTGKLKPLKQKSIPGFLSAKQISPHHTAHYGGALRGYVAADARVNTATREGTKLAVAEFGALKRAINSKGNSVVLHELYFDGMTSKKSGPSVDVRRLIVKRFGSLEKWSDDFQASAKAAAGWAMLVKHPVNGKLYNVVSDEHAHGLLWMAVPLVVIDVYEHAFYIDYHNRKTDYIAKFMDHIDWAEVNPRYRLAS